MIRRFFPSTIRVTADPAYELYLNCGTNNNIIHNGKEFIGDGNFSYHDTGSTYINTSASIYPLHQTERWKTVFTYTIPVQNGTYTVKTYHNEKYFGYSGPTPSAGQRVFSIYINDVLVKDSMDMYIEYNNEEVELIFSNIEVSNGSMVIKLQRSIDNATIDGIAITSQS